MTIPPIQQISLTKAEIDALMEGVNVDDVPQIVQKPLPERVAKLETLLEDTIRYLLLTRDYVDEMRADVRELKKRVADCESLIKCLSRDLLITNEKLREARGKISRLESAGYDD